MKQAGVNMVRTGIWTGWKKYMPEPGKVNESVLRAFDAFLLTAHKHDIPVIFTFFAFLPETWGGANAYLDPRAVKAQQEFVSAFTKRYPRVDDVLWDFINEPSFCSPKYLWNCRPNYDEFEKAVWKQWLKDRYPASSDEARVSHLQQLWRTTTDDVYELPQLKDFESVNLIDDRQPLKTLDYRLFAQDMFIRWTRQMTEAVRSNGNPKQLITVGQDEAGISDSPNIQFFAREIDFTSLHNWWANDDLVWDSVLAKTPSKLSLMEETGVMFYEKADADASWRSEEEVSRLLERKMAISFAVDGAGFIEWVWNTNPYMNSTNEVGIGLHRVDRSGKPELRAFTWFAQQMKIWGPLLRERQPEPVAMVIPHSQMFSPRSFAQEATRRCVRAMYYHVGVPMQAISEYTITDYSLNAKLFIVPSPGVLTEKCWDALLAAAKAGATIAISGVIDEDEYGWSVERSKLFDPVVTKEPVSQSEPMTIGAENFLVRYEGEKMQRIEKAVARSRAPFSIPYGSGYLMWSPLPLELGDSMAAVAAFYKLALARARVAPVFKAEPYSPSVLVIPSLFRDVAFYMFVSEMDQDVSMQVTHLENPVTFSVKVRAGRSLMILLDRKTGEVLSRDFRVY
ncbi:MAG TPA: cellulase family glycosylhydrolase, partial [Pyrinomonadaceae bacterium]|nr:cellulase family glycosylhydrolase [Pyrinomonadaceae bacterium]